MRTLHSVLLVLPLVAGCATTHVLSTWKEPGVTAASFHKVLVIAPNRDEAMRRTFEDELVKNIKNIPAIASYTLLNADQIQDRALVQQVVQQQGIDGIVVFRLVNVRKEATWEPGAYMGPAYAYGGWGFYDPGYIQVDTVARVETNVYAVPDDKLMWAAATDTFDPSSARNLVDNVAKAVAKEMRKQGFIP